MKEEKIELKVTQAHIDKFKGKDFTEYQNPIVEALREAHQTNLIIIYPDRIYFNAKSYRHNFMTRTLLKKRTPIQTKLRPIIKQFNPPNLKDMSEDDSAVFNLVKIIIVMIFLGFLLFIFTQLLGS